MQTGRCGNNHGTIAEQLTRERRWSKRIWQLAEALRLRRTEKTKRHWEPQAEPWEPPVVDSMQWSAAIEENQ